MSAFHVDLGQLDGELIAVDGFRSRPSWPGASRSRWRSGWTSACASRARPAAHPVLALLEGENKQTGIVLQAGRCAGRADSDTAGMLRRRSLSTWRAACAP
jgi:hypothetical protein